MRVLFSIFLILSIFFQTGCSQKDVKYETKKETISKEFDSDDDFLDEFEEDLELKEVWDPLSGYNRIMTGFNDGVYEYVLSPLAKGYTAITHKEVRRSVSNFFHNILYPVRLVNNLLQGKLKNSAEETGRFVINTTVGLFGLFDPAKSYFGLEPHNEDFGQTLGYWGVGAGPHIVLPILGPSNLRDTLSFYPDSIFNPTSYDDDRSYNLVKNYKESIVLKFYKQVNRTAQNPEYYPKLKEDAIDLYPYLRDVYEQYRENQIKE